VIGTKAQRRRLPIFKTEARTASIASSRFNTENRRAGSHLAEKLQDAILNAFLPAPNSDEVAIEKDARGEASNPRGI
jgi:hypothetical protein